MSCRLDLVLGLSRRNSNHLSLLVQSVVELSVLNVELYLTYYCIPIQLFNFIIIYIQLLLWNYIFYLTNSISNYRITIRIIYLFYNLI
jgi:hypothetical protein